MSLLNKFTLKEINQAIAENDKKLISSVQGIGQKMTDRIILELKSKLIKKRNKYDSSNISQFLSNHPDIRTVFEDLEITLHSLNYPKRYIKNVFPNLIAEINSEKISIKDKNNVSFENLLKKAMIYLDNNNSNLDQ